MFSFFLQPLAVAAEPTVVVESEGPAVTPDITKVDSIEDGFGYFRLLWEKTVAWFRSEQENLLELAIGIAVTIIVAFLVRWLFRALLPKLLRKLPSELPLKIVDRLGAPLTLLILLVGFSACNNLVHLPGAIALWLGKIFYAGFILAFLWGIFRIISLVDFYLRQRRVNEDRKLNQLFADLVRRTIKTAVWVMAIIFIAQNLFNLNVAALVAGAGVIGLVLAFAAQNTVGNLFGAMSIVSDKTFKSATGSQSAKHPARWKRSDCEAPGCALWMERSGTSRTALSQITPSKTLRNGLISNIRSRSGWFTAPRRSRCVSH